MAERMMNDWERDGFLGECVAVLVAIVIVSGILFAIAAVLS